MSHMETIARRKTGNQEGWKVCAWERVGDSDDLVVEGGVPRELKSGKRKGELSWRDVPRQKAVVTRAEMDAEHARYEAETGNCGDCFGKGEVFASWSARDGIKHKTCNRCGGSGKTPN